VEDEAEDDTAAGEATAEPVETSAAEELAGAAAAASETAG